MEERQNDMLPSTSATQFRSGANILPEEHSNAADLINWLRGPELKAFEGADVHSIANGYFWADELIGAPASERARL